VCWDDEDGKPDDEQVVGQRDRCVPRGCVDVEAISVYNKALGAEEYGEH
jgi:hypothetical protein